VLVSPKDFARFQLKADETATTIQQITIPIPVQRLGHESAEGFFLFPKDLGIAGFLTQFDGFGTMPIAAHENNAFSVNGSRDGYAVSNLVGNPP
jgi:hypothetical protein